MSYLCRAERQVLAKAYASSLDLNLSAPSRDTQVCRTSKSWLSVSSVAGCQQKQHGFFACVYRFSMTTKQPSTVSVYEEKKCLVESGKVTRLMKVRFDADKVPFRRPPSYVSTAAEVHFVACISTLCPPPVYYFLIFHFSFFTFPFSL